MNSIKEYLGKVSLTVNGKHDINKAYDRLCVVYTDINDTIKSYISKKSVPKNVPLSNRDYWQPIAVNFGDSGGSESETDPYAVTDLTIHYYSDETPDIPAAGTYILGTRQQPSDIVIRLEDLDWSTILSENIPEINNICTISNITSLDIEPNQTNPDKLDLDLVYYNNGTRILINSIDIGCATSTRAGLMSAEDKEKLDDIIDWYNSQIS